MTAPDVRYRLSVEGEQAIISAFAAIQAKAEGTGKGMSLAFGNFGEVLKGVRGLLGALGLAVSVAELVAFGKTVATSAEELSKMAQRLGSTTQNMSVLSLAAKLAGVDLGSLTQGLSKFTLVTQQAASGAGGPGANALKALGFSAKEVRDMLGQDMVQRISTVSQKFAALPDSAGKSAAALTLVGGRGAALIPVMNLLGTMGFEKLKKMAEDMGVMFDGPVLESIINMNQHFRLLGLEVQALATRFVGGLAQPVTIALEDITGELGSNANAWGIWGAAVGTAIAGVLLSIAGLADSAGTALKVLGIDMKFFRDIVTDWSRSVPKMIADAKKAEADAYADYDKRQAERVKAFRDVQGKNMSRLGLAGPNGVNFGGANPLGVGDGSDLNDLFGAKLSAQTSRLNSQLAVLKAKAALLEQADKVAFDAALIDVRGYYRDRMKIVTDNTAAEIATLKKRMAEELQDPNTEAGATAAAKTRSEIQQKELAGKLQLLQLQDEERKEVVRLGDEWSGIQEKVLDLQGRRHDAAMLQMETEYRKATEIAAKMGPSSAFGPVPDSYRQKQLEQLRAALQNAIDLNAVTQQANLELNDYTRVRTSIERLASAGLISEGEATNRILRLDDQRIASLEEVAAHMLVVAQASGDPEQVAKAEAVSASIEDIRVSMDAARDTSAKLKVAFQDALVAGAGTFLTTAIQNARTFADVWRAVALSIIDSLDQILAKIVQLQLAGFLAGLFGGSGGGSKILDSAVGGPTGATGGLLSGPGTGTSDSIIARVSAGEFIVREASVSQPGVLQHLMALNQLGLRALPRTIPSFAGGGLVPGSTTARLDGAVEIRLAEGLAGLLETPAGERSILRLIGKHRTTIGRLVG